MLKRVKGTTGDVYILRARLSDEDGNHPNEISQDMAINRVRMALGISEPSMYFHSYDKEMGNLTLVFNMSVKRTPRPTRHIAELR